MYIDIKKYGLDKPYISITAELSNGNELTVKASKADDDGKCYVMNKSGTTIFRMNSKSIEWYGLSRNDILTENILSIDMKYMKTLTIKENGKTLVSIEALGVVGDNQKTEKEPSREEILIKQLIQEKDARISDLQGQLAEANRQITVLQQLLAAKETQKQLEAPKRHWWQRWTKNDSN